ncbi:MAG: TrmH family RNA methyltransferase [Planctomycetota bacterium]
MHLVLLHPEIPHNTGCAARLAAALGLPLHLVEPLGFVLEDRYLKRAGLDYWPLVDLTVHADVAALRRHLDAEGERPFDARVRPFSARGGTSLFEVAFEPEDVLVFGRESTGLPDDFLAEHQERAVYVPIRPGVRSLNLANVVCLGAYTALHSAGVPLPSNDGGYTPDGRSGVQPTDVARRSKP